MLSSHFVALVSAPFGSSCLPPCRACCPPFALVSLPVSARSAPSSVGWGTAYFSSRRRSSPSAPLFLPCDPPPPFLPGPTSPPPPTPRRCRPLDSPPFTLIPCLLTLVPIPGERTPSLPSPAHTPPPSAPSPLLLPSPPTHEWRDARRAPPVPSTCLFLPELPSDLTDTLLERHFRGFVGFTSSRTRRDRNGKIVGFVEFETVDDASRCRDSMQGTSSFPGQTWQIHFSNNTRGPGAPPAQKRPREDDFGLPSAQALRTNSYGAGAMESDRLAAPTAPTGRPGYGQPPPYAAPLPDIHMQPPPANFLAMQLPPDASSTLYVEGLPADATEREVAHIFRRFEGQGYQSLRMVARESSKTPGRNLYLCFVEFDNAHQATIAMRQLQGYRLDKNSTEPGVKIVYAKTRAARVAARPPSSRPPRNDMYDSAPAAYDDRARAHDGRHADRHQDRGHRRDGREHSDSYQDDYDDSERGEEDLLGE